MCPGTSTLLRTKATAPTEGFLGQGFLTGNTLDVFDYWYDLDSAGDGMPFLHSDASNPANVNCGRWALPRSCIHGIALTFAMTCR